MIKSVTFTGSRKTPKEKDLMWRLHQSVEDFIEKGYTNFIQGGCYGADHLFAQSVLKHKEKHSHIKLITYIPHLNQDKLWREEDKEMYQHILKNSDEIVQVTDTEYTNYCMQLRNLRMIENCEQVLALWSGDKKSGTFSTIQKAIDAENVKGIYIIKF